MRQGHLRQDEGGPVFGDRRSENSDDQCDLFQGAPHGGQIAVEKGGPGDQRGRLISRTKGGIFLFAVALAATAMF